MKHFALIWDMDGTLVDSYPAIVPAARETLADFGLALSEEEIRREVLDSSVGALLERVAREQGWDPAPIRAAFQRLNDSRIEAIRPMPHARDCLAALAKAGCRSFVYTHRGASCPAILERTGLRPCFTELVTALEGFPRKPPRRASCICWKSMPWTPPPAFMWGTGDWTWKPRRTPASAASFTRRRKTPSPPPAGSASWSPTCWRSRRF